MSIEPEERSEIEQRIKLGASYFQQGRFDETITEYRKVIEMNSKDACAHNDLGVVYAEKGMLDEAIIKYKKALEIDSNLAGVHYNLGLAYAEKEMYDEAMTEFYEAYHIFLTEMEEGKEDVKKDLKELEKDIVCLNYERGVGLPPFSLVFRWIFSRMKRWPKRRRKTYYLHAIP